MSACVREERRERERETLALDFGVRAFWFMGKSLSWEGDMFIEISVGELHIYIVMYFTFFSFVFPMHCIPFSPLFSISMVNNVECYTISLCSARIALSFCIASYSYIILIIHSTTITILSTTCGKETQPTFFFYLFFLDS